MGYRADRYAACADVGGFQVLEPLRDWGGGSERATLAFRAIHTTLLAESLRHKMTWPPYRALPCNYQNEMSEHGFGRNMRQNGRTRLAVYS